MTTESLFTQLRQLQFRGPTTSDDYNARIEENYRDLVVLLNDARILQDTVKEGYARVIKEELQLIREIESLKLKVTALETDKKQFVFYSSESIDNDRFNGTIYEVSATSRLSYDSMYGLTTLPKVDGASVSRVAFVNQNGDKIIPSGLETRVLPIQASADNGTGYVDTSEPALAMIDKAGFVWERNVVVDNPNYSSGAQMYLYVKIPIELFSSLNSNVLNIKPFPCMGINLLAIDYTTAPDVVMEDADVYTPLNVDQLYEGNRTAVGYVPPGSWVSSTDQIIDCGNKAFYFDPKPITGLRLHLKQDRFYQEGSKYIYSYGLSGLDLRYDKFLSTGRTLLRFDAPSGSTISTVRTVQPEIYNVDPAILPEAFSYRVIWETAYESGVYSLTPVALSKRVWIEVSLNSVTDGASPALSRLTVTYT